MLEEDCAWVRLPRDRSFLAQPISTRKAQQKKKPTNLCASREFLKQSIGHVGWIIQSCYSDYKINRPFACSRCLISVSCSVHVISRYYVRKGSWAFLDLNYPQISEVRESDHVDKSVCRAPIARPEKNTENRGNIESDMYNLLQRNASIVVGYSFSLKKAICFYHDSKIGGWQRSALFGVYSSTHGADTTLVHLINNDVFYCRILRPSQWKTTTWNTRGSCVIRPKTETLRLFQVLHEECCCCCCCCCCQKRKLLIKFFSSFYFFMSGDLTEIICGEKRGAGRGERERKCTN